MFHRTITLTIVLVTGACGLIPRPVSHDDPTVVRLLSAVAKVDRASMGFTEIAADAPITLESRPRAGYDAMLHIGGRTQRTIAFRRVGADYTWIGEQEIFEGPRKYETVDGTSTESITLTFELSPVSGVPLNKLNVLYRGPDEMNLAENLSLEQVRPILTRWGYQQADPRNPADKVGQ